MFRVKESMHVNAPIDRCFLISTNVDLVAQTIGLRAVAGRTHGRVVGGDHGLWRGWKFGLPALHESVISRYDRPHFFQDSMVRGRFASFAHDHQFNEVDGHTLLVDIVRFSLPFGPLGKMAAKAVVVPHVLKLMGERFTLLKRLAEGDGWQQYVGAEAPGRIEQALAGIQPA